MAKSDAQVLADLKTRRDVVVNQLRDMTSTSVGGLPNATGGEQIDHVGYRKSLREELKELNELIAQLDNDWTVDEYVES